MSRTPQRPKLGQNFLISPTAQIAIADALGDISQRTVVEIGPGRGAISRILARRAQRLIAIELDQALAAQLQADFSDQPSVTILNQNILTTNLAALAEAHAATPGDPERRDSEQPVLPDPAHTALGASVNTERSSRLLLVGNLPYYITSDILLHLFAAHRVIDRAVVMIQREVADRVAAQPGSRDYGLLSVTAQLYARIEKLFVLPPEAFSPPPQVHSTVLRLTMQPRLDELGLTDSADSRATNNLDLLSEHDLGRVETPSASIGTSTSDRDISASPTPSPDTVAAFVNFLRTCFAQKRKTLANNLRAAGHSPDSIAAALGASGIAPQSRAEQLDLPTLAKLYRQFNQPR